MKTRTAIVRNAPSKWEVVEVDLDGPRQGELLVRMVASGLCHSDDHLTTGDLPVSAHAMAGGHEGSAIVEEVGPDTPDWKPGDRIVMSFLPSCGRCRWCATGMQNLCDHGAITLSGVRLDGSFRMTLDGEPVGQMSGLATFSEYSTISVQSAVRCPDDVPLEVACLTGCGVGTGWGSAVNSAEVRPGDVVIVMGVGGIGINAVQGASHAGASVIVAVDPVEFKRSTALKLGATHAVATMEEAMATVHPLTNGQGADSCIVCVGVTGGEHVAQGLDAVRKGGTCVVTGIGKMLETGIPVSPTMLTLFQKRIQGSLFGASNPTRDIPLMLELYRQGRLRLDELVTRTYTLDQVNEGYADMHAGRNIRGVIVHQH
ncbi:MAG: NDMA-dependent alcohol dehydrogenase [Acidimicrobiales bacterium]|jgi:NDMA-dependent alcohol dehydrogenase